MPSLSETRSIGLIGIINLSILTMITLWRTILFISKTSLQEIGPNAYWKKFIFHLLLLFTTICDLPMYVGFWLYNDYVMVAYAFHKLECTLLFGAVSITISDWTTVLYDIHEESSFRFMFRQGTLVTLNVLLFIISTTCFIFIYVVNDMDMYMNSWLYLAGIFFQIGATFVLACFMLNAGFKLWRRIKGATGNQVSNSSSANTISQPFFARFRQPSVETNSTSAKVEFQSALRCLLIVVFTYTICVFIQIVLLSLNYILGYSTDKRKTVGPLYFYWTFYAWLPLWGPILALLYISRSRPQRRTAERLYVGDKANVDDSAAANNKFHDIRTVESSDVGGIQGLTSRLLGSFDNVVQNDINSPIITAGGVGVGDGGGGSSGGGERDHQDCNEYSKNSMDPDALDYISDEVDAPFSPDSSINYSSHQLASEIFFRDIHSLASMSSIARYSTQYNHA